LSKICVRISLTTLICLLWMGSTSHALFWQDPPLVTINDQSWDRQDFLNWWQEWKEPGMEQPQSPDDFIDWILLSDEAEQMQLYDEPRFKQKVHTFLKVRSLMMLKNEEVDEKISVSDEEIDRIYHRDYTPLLKLRSIELDSEEQCAAFMQAVSQGLSSDEVLSDPALKLPQTGLSEPIVQRPNQLPPHVRTLYEQDPQTRYLPAYSYQDRWFILEIMQRDPGNDNDRANVAESISYTLRKDKQRELTGQLNMRLMEKYQVKMDEQGMKRIHEDGPEEDVAEAAMITFPDFTITGQILYKNALSHYQRFGGKEMKDTSFEEIVQRVANDIVAQSLTSMEALNRHYESKPPFQSVYFFYQRHRLIRELESKLILPYTKVSDEELSHYYNEHREDYAYPVRVRYASVETRNEKMALKLREDLRQGADFYQTLSPLSPAGIETKTTPLAHLIPEMQDLIDRLQPGQSDMLEVDGYFHFIRLIEEPKVDYKPFDQIRDALKVQLTQAKFSQRRAELVAQLRQRTTITVNQNQWQRCLNELNKGQ